METRKLIRIIGGILVFIFFALGGSNLFQSGSTKLGKMVTELQSSCPSPMGEGMTMVSAEMKDGMVVIGTTVSDPNIIEYLFNQEHAKERMSLTVLLNDKMLNTLVDANSGLCYEYALIGKDSTIVVSLTADEVNALKKIKSSPKELACRWLANDVETENKSFPTFFAEGMTLTLGTIADGELIYLIVVDESEIDFLSLITNHRSELKQLIYDSLDFSSNQTQFYMQRLVDAEYKLVYKFTGNESKKSLRVVFPVDEIKDHLKKHQH